MSIFDLANQLKNQQAGGFSEAPLLVDDSDKWRYSNSAPCPDFVERLPGKLKDPETGNEFYLTQSKIKNLIAMMEGELCPHRLYKTDIAGQAEEESTHVMNMGKRFEYQLTGALPKYGELPERFQTAKGADTADQKRIDQNAKLGKKTLGRLGIDPDAMGVSVQDEFVFKCLQANVDLLTSVNFHDHDVITDIKYSGCQDSKWTDYSYHVDHIHRNFSAKVQALHYTMVCLLYGIWDNLEDARFMFLAFNSQPGKEGEYHPTVIKFTEDHINQHKWLILTLLEQLEKRLNGEGFDKIPSYKNCASCPVKCNQYVQYPELKEMTL